MQHVDNKHPLKLIKQEMKENNTSNFNPNLEAPQNENVNINTVKMLAISPLYYSSKGKLVDTRVQNYEEYYNETTVMVFNEDLKYCTGWF